MYRRFSLQPTLCERYAKEQWGFQTWGISKSPCVLIQKKTLKNRGVLKWIPKSHCVLGQTKPRMTWMTGGTMTSETICRCLDLPRCVWWRASAHVRWGTAGWMALLKAVMLGNRWVDTCRHQTVREYVECGFKKKHKPPMTGNGNHTTYQKFVLGDALLLFYPHYII